MKKLSKKLSLNKETLTVLGKGEMANVKGGFTSIFSCHTDHGRGAPYNCSGCQTCCSGPNGCQQQ